MEPSGRQSQDAAEYYAEETFVGHKNTGKVYTGYGTFLGARQFSVAHAAAGDSRTWHVADT